MSEYHALISILSTGLTKPRSSKVIVPSKEEWQSWATGAYRRAVVKAGGPVGDGPLYVSSWLAIRAHSRGWDKLFEFWGRRAHHCGEPTEENLTTPRFVSLGERLALDERLTVSWHRFTRQYERDMGYPLKCGELWQDIPL